MTATTLPRIDKLVPGTMVGLDYAGRRYDRAIFLGVEGTGDDRRARFLSKDHGGDTYEWEAYRYNGRWAFGSSAERLTIGEVVAAL